MKKLLTSIALFGAMLLTGVSSANAEEFPKDGSAISLGTVYNVTKYLDYHATITPEVSGTLLQDGAADLKIQGLTDTYRDYGKYGQVYSYEVEAGVTYDITGWPMGDSMVCFEMIGAKPIEILSAVPSIGSTYTVTINGGAIDLQFNQPVTYSGATLTAGTSSTSLSGMPIASSIVSFKIKDTVNKWYNSEAVKGGETLVLTINGLKDMSGNLYKENGLMTLTFKLANKAVQVTSASINKIQSNHFLSYYAQSNEDGVLVFEFTDNIKPNTAFVTITAGRPDVEEKYWFETSEDISEISDAQRIGLTVEGNKVYVDLRGKLRDLNHCQLDDNPNIWVGVKLSNVRDMDGGLVLANYEGGEGSIEASMLYEYITPSTIVSEFLPAAGSNLSDVDEIEIWFNNAQAVTYTGVDFDCDGNVINVPLSEINVSKEDNEHTLLVPVPAAAKTAANVVVTLSGMESVDGYDHTQEITATYNTFVIQLVGPFQPGASIDATGDDDFVFSLLGETVPGYMRYDFYNEADGSGNPVWIYGSWLTLDEATGYYTSYNGNYTCYNNFDPMMVVRCYDSEGDYWAKLEPTATFTFTFKGTTKAFAYSTYNLVSVSPEPNSTITDLENIVINMKFDGLVRIDGNNSGVALGMGMGLLPFANTEAVGATEDDPEGYANEWNLYISPSFISSTTTGFDIAIKAYDLDGLLVQGNMGGKEMDYFSYSYGIYNADNLVELNVTPGNNSSVAELYSIEISHADYAVGRDWTYTGEMPQIFNRLMEPVYTFTAENIEVYSEITGYDEVDEPIYDEVTKVFMFVDPAITEEGAYTLIIPEGFFAVGSQFETYKSAEISATIYVGMDAPTVFAIEPADGETLTELPRIIINTTAVFNEECWDAITLKNDEIWYGAEWSHYGTLNGSVELITEDGNIIGYTLNFNDYSGNQPAEDGVYTLTIPAGMFILDNEPTPEVIVTYYLGGGGSGVALALNPAAGIVKELTRIDITADEIEWAQVMSDEPLTIVNENFETVYTISADEIRANSFDYDTWTFNGYYLEPNITEPGEYTLTIPSGYFEFMDMSKSKSLTATYKILPAGSRDLTITPSHGTTVGRLEKFIIEDNDIMTNMDHAGTVTIEHSEHGRILSMAPIEIEDCLNWNTWCYEIPVIDPLGDEGNARSAVTAGTYTLTIPEHFFRDWNGEYNKECVAVITVDGSESGISQIIVDKAGSYTVYDLRGIKVLETENASELGTLAKGVYVVNGKKVLVK